MATIFEGSIIHLPANIVGVVVSIDYPTGTVMIEKSNGGISVFLLREISR